jgi:hypothetical protein
VISIAIAIAIVFTTVAVRKVAMDLVAGKVTMEKKTMVVMVTEAMAKKTIVVEDAEKKAVGVVIVIQGKRTRI